MTRRSRGRGRGRKSDAFPIGWAILAAVVFFAIVAGFGWLYVQASARNVALADDFCPLTGPSEQVLVLVDATDAISPITQTELLNHLSDLAGSVRKGGRFELRILEPGTDRTRTLFSSCNPGDGSDLDHWTGNPEAAQRRWRDSFDGPLREAMAQALIAAGADTSPIMAGIQQIAVDRLGTEQLRSIPAQLVVVSDMLENTAYFSMYQSGADLAAFAASDAARRFRTNLAGATTEIWLIQRETRVSSRAVAEFWAGWIAQNGGAFGRALQLQGIE